MCEKIFSEIFNEGYKLYLQCAIKITGNDAYLPAKKGMCFMWKTENHILTWQVQVVCDGSDSGQGSADED
jgi:hypothetical protein